MNKFILKFFVIFVSAISLMFFSLVFFQKMMMEKEHGVMPPPPAEFEYGGFAMPPAPPAPPKEPPIAIPLVFILGLGSLFVFLILKYIDNNFVKPLGIIENNVKKIKDGSLDANFETSSENENIQSTFKTMNEMVRGLKQREKLQDNYIRNIVHDLRAPVIAQERAMEILSDEFGDNMLFDGMVKNNEAYLKMINSIIESLSMQDIKIEKMDFDFSKLTNTVIDALKPAAEAKHIELRTSMQNNLTVWADYLSFNRIITNLVSNAIENIDSNKIVTVKAVKNKKSTIITIEDNGQGMSEEQKDKLFVNHLSRNNSGKKSVSGIGLSVVYDLVTKNGGEIRVETEKDKYTKFIIELSNEGQA